MSFFEYAGMSTAAIPGLLIEAKNIYGLPERDVEKIHVPGRNGDVLIDYKNPSFSSFFRSTKLERLKIAGRHFQPSPFP